MQNGRTIEVLGTTVQVPDGLEKVRLSIGVQGIINVGDENLPASILLMNRKRLQKKGDPQFGLPGGAAELKYPPAAKKKLAQQYDINPGQFENDRDARLTGVPVEILKRLVPAMCGMIDFPGELVRELTEELGPELTEFEGISGGRIKASAYTGLLPDRDDMRLVQHYVFPIETSARSDSASLRVQAVYEVNPPTELGEFIAINSKRLDLSRPMEVDTPMLVVPQAIVGSLVELLDESAEESAKLPDVKLAGTETPISIAGLVRLLK